MAQTKLNLGRLNIQQLLQSANNIKTAMTGNASFTTPIPPLATIATLITSLTTANNTYQSGLVTQSQNLTQRDNAVDALAAALTSLAAYVQAQSGGDAAKIQSAGMDVKGTPAPAGLPGQVTNLSVTFGDNAGELDAQWDSDPAAYSYEIQTSPDPMTATSWVAQPAVTKSSTALLGLTSGTRQCPIRFRQEWIIADDAADFFFPAGTTWTTLTEVRLKDAEGGSAGNIDVVLCAYDKAGKVFDFGALEVQAVYISGNVRNPFEHYMEAPAKNAQMDWTNEANYPRPDYLSSSRKRLAPQLIFKGGIINAWNKKSAVALNKGFFDTLPDLPEVSKDKADIAWTSKSQPFGKLFLAAMQNGLLNVCSLLN